MKDSRLFRPQVFDPKQEFSVVERRLPHWTQAGTLSFITWRTWDSIPKQVLENWLDERTAWLKRHGIDPGSDDWQPKFRRLEPALVEEFRRHVADRWNEQLDNCHGECLLRRPDLASLVSDALLHFDGQRYELTDFVVMPNHIHVLAAFSGEGAMLQQIENWKHFAATRIHRTLGRKGRFWQQDGFDHLVRSHEQFERIHDYIADNPRRAGLQAGEFLHWSKR